MIKAAFSTINKTFCCNVQYNTDTVIRALTFSLLIVTTWSQDSQFLHLLIKQ